MITVVCPSPSLDVTYFVDELTPGAIHRPRQVLKLAGGKGLNLARAAKTLGTGVLVVVPLGGHVGGLIADLAAADGIELRVVPADAETRTCVSVIPDDGASTEFYEASAPADAAALQAATAKSDWVAIAGRVPDDSAGFAGVLGRGRTGALDTSGPGLATLIDAAHPGLVKVNVHEAAELLGRNGSPLELAQGVAARSGGAVVVTAGAGGAVAVDAAGAWRAAPDPQPGWFAIGSGDSFFAGLLVALAAGAALPDALRSASAAGSANTRAPGAGVFTRTDYESALQRIEVHPL